MILKVVIVLLILFAVLLFVPSAVMQKEATLFSDDFNDGNDNGWGPKIGTWAVVNGEYTATGTSGTPMSQAPIGPLSDFVFEADLRITQRGAAQLALRLQSLSSTGVSNVRDGILLVIFPGGRSIYWHVIRNGIGAPQDMKPLSMAVDENRLLKIKVKVQGNTYEAYVNDALANTLVDGTFPSGYVALGVSLNYPTPTRWDNILISAPQTPARASVFLMLVSGAEGQLHVGDERALKLEVMNLRDRTVTYTVSAISDSVQLIGPVDIPVKIDPLLSRQVAFAYRATEIRTGTIRVTVYEDSTVIAQSQFAVSISANPAFWEIQPPWYVYVFISAVVGSLMTETINRLRHRRRETVLR